MTGLLGVSAGSSHPEHLSVEYNVKSVHAFLLDLDTQQEMQFRGGEGSPDVGTARVKQSHSACQAARSHLFKQNALELYLLKVMQ